MPHLTADADRLVRARVDAFLEGKARPESLADTLYSSKNSTYRVIEGRIHEATDASLKGAELVGFLVEEGRAFRIAETWTLKARAIFFDRATRDVVVTSRIVTKSTEEPKRERTPTPGTIPPAPPVPLFKTPSLNLAESASLPAYSPARTHEEITNVDVTRAMDSVELEGLRDSSANLVDPPTLRSEPARPSEPPTMRFPKAPPRPVVDPTGDDAPTKLAPQRDGEQKRRFPPVKPPPQKKK